jgi:predicted Zn-dependent protease
MRVLARASLAALLAAACATPGAPRATSPPMEEPTTLAHAVADEQAIGASIETYDDPLVLEYLAGVADRLLLGDERASGARGVSLVVLRDPTVNAFALPTGRIYLHTGLLSRLDSEAQLAAVLARALAHLARNDARWRRAGDAEIVDAIARIAPSIAAALPATPAAGDEAGAPGLSATTSAILGKRLGVAYVAAMTGHGRDAESQADAGAVARLAQAGYDVREGPRAFERLRRAARAGGALERFFLGTDAALAERVDSMRRLVAASESRAPEIAATAGEYQSRLAAVVRENASLEIRAGRFRAAQEQLDRLLAAVPGDALGHLYYGDLHRLRSQRARSVADRDELARAALASYERCAALDPSVSVVLRQLGLLHYQQRQLARAREAFARYVELNPDAPDAGRVSEYLAPPRIP